MPARPAVTVLGALLATTLFCHEIAWFLNTKNVTKVQSVPCEGVWVHDVAASPAWMVCLPPPPPPMHGLCAADVGGSGAAS